MSCPKHINRPPPLLTSLVPLTFGDNFSLSTSFNFPIGNNKR